MRTVSVIHTNNRTELSQVTLPLITNEQCDIWYNAAVTSDNMVCAGFEHGQEGACQVRVD